MNKIKYIFRDTMNEYTDKLKSKGCRVWSISRLNNFNTCPMQYYLTYIAKAKQKQGVYSLLGSSCHSDLEDLYTGDNIQLIPKHFNEDWMKAEIFNIPFPVSKGDIKGNYKKDIYTFYKHYKKMDGKFISELGFILQISDKDFIMGYIDLIEVIDEKRVKIYDFKTSAMFKDKKLIDAGHQLCVYQMALEQLYGLEVVDNGWIMLKYSDVQIANNKPMVGVQNKDIVKKCKTQIIKLMIKSGIDEAMAEMYYYKCEADNSFKCLPELIKKQIHIQTHFKEYKIAEEVKSETMNYIKNTIKAIDELDKNNKNQWNKQPQDFFCKNLCSFHPIGCDGYLNN